MAEPKTFGTPIGATGGKPINAGRPKPGPAAPGVVSDYLKHMIAADRAHGGGGQARPSGSSGGPSQLLAKGNPPVGVGGRRREAAIMDTVDKASR